MIDDVALDRLLRDWLSAGPERAPEADVQEALRTVAATRQRRWAWPSARPIQRTPDRRWLLVLAIIAVTLALAVGLATGSLPRFPDRNPLVVVDPTPSPSPTSTSAPTPPAQSFPPVALVPAHIDDWAVELSVPDGWAAQEYQCCDYAQFTGTVPDGSVSVGNESPYSTSVCDPECHRIELPANDIPFSLDHQLEVLRDSVAELASRDDWAPLPDGTLPSLENGARLEATGPGPDGRLWRTVYVIGSLANNVVSFSWSQPDKAFDAVLADRVMAGVVLKEAPTYSNGDLNDVLLGATHPFSIRLPGSWLNEEQPGTAAGPLSGATRFGERNVFVSIGSPDGTLGWCAGSDCRELSDLHTVEAIEEAIVADGWTEDPGRTTLGGEPAKAFRIAGPPERRLIIAVHAGRPVAVMLDATGYEVAPGALDEILDSFGFLGTELQPVAHTFTTGRGNATLGLPDGWDQSATNEGRFTKSVQRLTVVRGAADGTITTCTDPAAPWELCRKVKVKTLDELVAAVQPAPIQDHGVGPPTGRVTSVTLDGEPAVVTRIQAYEYPARSGQEVVYIVAFHDGRPWLLRIRTSANEARDIDEVVAGFRFVD